MLEFEFLHHFLFLHEFMFLLRTYEVLQLQYRIFGKNLMDISRVVGGYLLSGYPGLFYLFIFRALLLYFSFVLV